MKWMEHLCPLQYRSATYRTKSILRPSSWWNRGGFQLVNMCHLSAERKGAYTIDVHSTLCDAILSNTVKCFFKTVMVHRPVHWWSRFRFLGLLGQNLMSSPELHACFTASVQLALALDYNNNSSMLASHHFPQFKKLALQPCTVLCRPKKWLHQAGSG